jgi:hypothetical protein
MDRGGIFMNNIFVKRFIFLMVSFVFVQNSFSRENITKKSYNDFYKMLPKEAVSELEPMAKGGDEKSALVLANILKRNHINDFFGNGAEYWYARAAELGSVPAKLELGYAAKYSVDTKISCSNTTMTITTRCDSFGGGASNVFCSAQVFSFSSVGGDKISERGVQYINYKNAPSIAYQAACSAVGSSNYYIVYSAIFSADSSCAECEWYDVFDLRGGYVGSSIYGSPIAGGENHILIKGGEYGVSRALPLVEINRYPSFNTHRGD